MKEYQDSGQGWFSWEELSKIQLARRFLIAKIEVMRFVISLVFLISVLFLSGCFSTRYGVDEETWEGLTEAQKTATITSYNRRKEMEAARRLLEARTRHDEIMRQTNAAVENANTIKVKILDGRLKYKSKIYKIKPTGKKLTHGTVTKLKLKHSEEVDLLPEIPISYVRGRFIFGEDEGTSLIKSSLQYPYEADWKSGKTYRHESMPISSDVRGTVDITIETPSPEKDNDDDLLLLLIKELID